MSDIAKRRMSTATLEDVQVRFRNFSGKEGQYNRKGDRNFAVLLPEDVAQAMGADGWSIKHLKPREEGDPSQAYIKVKVNFTGPRPPQIVMITSRGRTTLPEEMVDILDWADFANVDLTLSPYQWEVNGNKGVTAYLHNIFITIREDELELKYADVPELEIGGREPQNQLESAQHNVIVMQESSVYSEDEI